MYLHQDSWAKVFVGHPPVTGAGGTAASAQNALVHSVKALAVLGGLQVLALGEVSGLVADEPRLDRCVLVIEVAHVWHEILQHIHVRQRVNLGVLRRFVDVGEASKRVAAIDVHRAGTADTLAARATECERGVLLIFDFEKRVQNHWTAVCSVNFVVLEVRGLLGVGVVAIDLEGFDRAGFGCCSTGHGAHGNASRRGRCKATHGRAGEHFSS